MPSQNRSNVKVSFLGSNSSVEVSSVGGEIYMAFSHINS